MNNSQRIWNALGANDVDTVAYLPCNKLNALMAHRPDAVDVWDITRESSGLGLCFGRSLAGRRTAMMIQNTGLGNLVTELYTMQKLYRTALPIFVSWRGHHREPIEAQVIFGTKIEALLEAIDVDYRVVAGAGDLEDLEADLARCFAEERVKVYLLSPETWEENSPDFHVFGRPRLRAVDATAEAYAGTPTLNRLGAIEAIVSAIDEDDVVLSQIGFPSKELYNTKDRDANFYMLGALGAATEVGIGLARALADRHVYVIDGDGSFFFNTNQLVDIAALGPANLTVVCLDNGSWGSTGNQPTLSSAGYNLSGLVRALGIDSTFMGDDAEALRGALRERRRFVHFMIEAGNDKTGGEIPLAAVAIKERFMRAIGTGA